MKNNINLRLSSVAIKQWFVNFLHRFHVMLFVVIVLGGLIAVTLMLNNIIVRSADTSTQTNGSGAASFDDATIKRIENLKTSGQGSDFTLPPGRTSPFVE